MDDQEFIEHQYSLLATYRRNLRIILEQAAQHGGEALAPLELANQLHIQRTCIAQVKATLRDLGVIVDEYENEQPPKADAEPPRRRPQHNLANPGYREFIARPRYQQALVEWLSNRYPIMLVSGLGGSGKSSLVYETVYRAVSGDPATPQFEAAVWVSDKGSQGTTLAGLLDEIALTLGHRGLTQLDDSVKHREIEHLLRTCKTLLVIDNFETIRDRQLYPWLKQKLPTPSKAIITSRSRNNLAGYDLIELEGMTEDEARAFLHQQTHQFEHTRTLAPAQIDGLIAAAGGNPKVMDVALRMLMLDYDGTLAPFRVERDQAVPYPGVREVLAEIIAGGRTRLVLISGRAIRDLLPLLAMEQAPEIWGTHGWEHRLANGAEEPLVLPDAALEGFGAATAWAEQHNLHARIEHKPASRALHWRGMEAARIDELRAAGYAAWEPLASRYNLDLKPFDGGLELSLPGRDKGHAVGAVLHETAPDAAVAFLGDDRTDEDGFRVLKGHGLAVLVRTELKATEADVWITPPEELLEFLRLWR